MLATLFKHDKDQREKKNELNYIRINIGEPKVIVCDANQAANSTEQSLGYLIVAHLVKICSVCMNLEVS